MAAAPALKATSLSDTATTPPAPVVIEVGRADVLTVGAGMEFATLGDALRAAVSGDTIAVRAGTYTNDFGTVSANVSIVAVGGLVHEVATVPPPDDKGILTVNANLTIDGFTFTGGSDGSPDGNVAGIRLQTGNLNVEYCSFTGMQEGLLADPNPVGTVTIDHSFFLDNGTGDGLTHNLYVGAVKSLLVTNSLFEGAVVGHEIKSRAAFTTIENNTIIDGPTGTGSYDIDIPNGGVALVENNIIEKGPEASNDYAIHYGGETQYSYAQNSLNVVGNTIINDMAASIRSVAVLNQSSVNGANVTVQIDGNMLWNYTAGNVTIGLAHIFSNSAPSSEPVYSSQSPLLALPSVQLGAGAQVLHLTTGSHTVTGGAGLLVVSDTAGSNTISGGSGGMQVSAAAGWDQIFTASGAADTVNTPGRNSVVMSNGTDRINATGAYELIEATGQATIEGSGFSTYELNGAGEQLTTSCSGFLNIGAGGRGVVHNLGGDLSLTIAAGGRLVIVDSADTVNGGAVAQATVSGAVTGQIANVGTISLTTGSIGALVQAGGGKLSVTGGAGNDTLLGGGGMDVFALGGGQDSVVFGSGSASVTAGAGADRFVFNGGADGQVTIAGYQAGVDSLVFKHFSPAAIASGNIENGSTLLTLSDGTTIDLAGVVLPGYPQGGGQGSPGGGTQGGSGGGGGTGGITPPPPVAGGTLTTGGHDVVGGASLLSVNDAAGSNTIAGGSGGLHAVAAYSDLLNTEAGSTNQINLSCYDTLNGGGTDQVTVSGYHNSLAESGLATLSLLGTVNTVAGGAALMDVTDTVGSNSIIGGSGGLVATLAGSYDQMTTAQGAADTISLSGYNSAVLSQGNDVIALSGVSAMVTVTGAASVTDGTGYGTYVLDGADTVSTGGVFAATVGGAADVAFASSGEGGSVQKLAGGTLVLSQTMAGVTGSATISGGQASISARGAAYAGIAVTVTGGSVVTGGSGPLTVTSMAQAGAAADTILAGVGAVVANSGAQGLNLMAGAGNVTLNGGAGPDIYSGGSGLAQLNLGSGADAITFGNGGTTVSGGGADEFVVPAGCHGSAVIQNWSSQDSFATVGQGAAAIVSDSVGGAGCLVTFAGGAQIELVGVSHFP